MQIHKLLSFMQEFIWAQITLDYEKEKSCLMQICQKDKLSNSFFMHIQGDLVSK